MMDIAEIETYIRSRLYKVNIWAPSFGGITAIPAGTACRYVLVGKWCAATLCMPNAGTSNATSFSVTAPFTAATIAGFAWYAAAQVMDNGIVSATPGVATIATGSGTINIYPAWSGGTWTATGDKRANFTLLYEVA